jgi:hypothetical protein
MERTCHVPYAESIVASHSSGNFETFVPHSAGHCHEKYKIRRLGTWIGHFSFQFWEDCVAAGHKHWEGEERARKGAAHWALIVPLSARQQPNNVQSMFCNHRMACEARPQTWKSVVTRNGEEFQTRGTLHSYSWRLMPGALMWREICFCPSMRLIRKMQKRCQYLWCSALFSVQRNCTQAQPFGQHATECCSFASTSHSATLSEACPRTDPRRLPSSEPADFSAAVPLRVVRTVAVAGSHSWVEVVNKDN